MQISLFISTRVHQWSGGTDGRTDTVLIGDHFQRVVQRAKVQFF